MISLVKFYDNTQISWSAHVHSYLEQGQIVDGYRVRIEFDEEDDRFLLLVGTQPDKNHPKPHFYQRIPLTSVNTILYEKHPHGGAVQPTAKK